MQLRSLAITTLLLTLASGAAAKTLIVLPRPGQVGFTLQGAYAGFTNQGTIGEDFGQGPGIAVRIRYRMRYERAIGLSFEAMTFDARTDAKFTDPLTGEPQANSDPTAPKTVTVITSGVDFYKMFGTRANSTRMLSASAGIAQVRTKLNDGETDFRIPDGVYLGAGAGVERFFWRSWALDLSGRYLAVFVDGKANNQLQAAVGLVVYASY